MVVPDINDTEEDIAELNRFIRQIRYIDKVELLGYHTMAVNKYGKLGIAKGMSVLQVAQNLGPTILAPAFGAAASTMGWNMAGLCILLPLMIAAFVALLFVKTR